MARQAGLPGGAVSVTRTQKQKPGVKVKANGPLATEAPVFLASDAKMRELLAARDETIEAQLTLLAERDATIAELNSQIERLSLQVRYYLGLSTQGPSEVLNSFETSCRTRWVKLKGPKRILFFADFFTLFSSMNFGFPLTPSR